MSGVEESVDLAIVIPWRDPGDGERKDNFDYVYEHYRSMNVGPVFAISDGREAGQPFNRSAAYNRGYDLCVRANVVLWNEADTILPKPAVEHAAQMALDEPGLVVPFTERHELNAEQTAWVLQGVADPFNLRGATVYPDGRSIGQAGLTSVATMNAIGGRWDEGFEGWGYDDNAMFHIFAELAGPPRFVAGKGVHLWHTPVYHAHTPQSRATTDRNAARYAAIKNLRGAELLAYLRPGIDPRQDRPPNGSPLQEPPAMSPGNVPRQQVRA